jgi:hypothetical protein
MIAAEAASARVAEKIADFIIVLTDCLIELWALCHTSLLCWMIPPPRKQEAEHPRADQFSTDHYSTRARLQKKRRGRKACRFSVFRLFMYCAISTLRADDYIETGAELRP